MLDNGLTFEQQKQMDNIYENLMSKLKEKDINLFAKLRKNELTENDIYKLINSNNKDLIIDDKEQYQLFGD
jgi:stress response protein YsnF